MKISVLLAAALVLLPMLAFPVQAQEDKICAYFFYGQGCPHCGRAEIFLDEMQQKYPNLEITRFEVYQNRDNLLLLTDHFNAHNISEEERGVPVLFIGETYLVGDMPIIYGLEPMVQDIRSLECPTLEAKNGYGQAGPTSPLEGIGLEFFAVVVGAALVDSINPCAIAVLLILLGALLTTTDKKRALKTGLAFTLSIYIAYFLFGIGLLSAIQISGVSYLFYQFIGFLAIIIGLFNIKDFFWYGGCGFAMEIPCSWRPSLKGLLRKVVSPIGAFFVGFIVCLFELPCTGGPYFFILGLLAERTTQLMAVPILLFYNLIFVLPLVGISLAMYYGYTTVEKAGEWKDRNIRLLHLVAGLVMIGLGLAVLLQWV